MIKNRLILLIICLTVLLSSCLRPDGAVKQADEAAYGIVAQKQDALQINYPFTLQRAESRLRQRLLPNVTSTVATANVQATPTVVHLTLTEALQVAAHNSRSFQDNKEAVYRAALALDLERDAFRGTWSSVLSSEWLTDKSTGQRVSGLQHGGDLGVSRLFKSGAEFALSVGLDLVQLLTANRVSARGIVADASLSIPLLRGAGREIVTEPLQQAERNVVYALWDFERFRRSFAVDVASEYLLVLERMNRVDTAYDNYQRLVASRKRARRLADAGRITEIEVDQALQNELTARSNWVSAQQTSAARLDNFKILLGLPPDSPIELDRSVLTDLGGQQQIDLEQSDMLNQLMAVALQQRRDLRVEEGRKADEKRAIRVAEDALRAELTLLASGHDGGSRSLSAAASDDASLDPDEGQYSALLNLDLPFERTAERNALRRAWLNYEAQQRSLEALEDNIKLQVRTAWRQLKEAQETIDIQSMALHVAQRRVESTNLFLRAGRIQIRDLLEAEDDLVSARNALVQAQVQYRITALELLRDLGTLTIDDQGGWLEDISIEVIE
ncbi:TolC family protein [Desulfuromonas acetoxidans]|uniref:TolC family protein n=2 Tax=Desulfuromonas acetoxidans TaxID=891 RepID=UPI001592D618|nr:TolC family protein [Desulfuromonas acetoxidans]MBF0644582.1 TolC family protein [Desulfuromonas acetoxidans]NVD23891.1 TolC family protein [Desulfuromonas acetoxidans]NVE16188.1 TolC family protein [Desulfuromonas acetoxidans]